MFDKSSHLQQVKRQFFPLNRIISTKIFFFFSAVPSPAPTTNFKAGFCVDTPILGRLAPITLQFQSKKLNTFFHVLFSRIYLHVSFQDTQQSLLQANRIVTPETSNPIPPPLQLLQTLQTAVEPSRPPQPSEPQVKFRNFLWIFRLNFSSLSSRRSIRTKPVK